MKDPSINLDFRNNVVFNWAHRTLDGRPHSINVVNNYYKAGPASRPGVHLVKMQSLHDGTFGMWYINGNLVEEPAGSYRQSGLVIIDAVDVPLASVLTDQPADFAPVSTQTAEEAYEAVLRGAGAIRPKRDAHDERILREVRSGRTTFGNGIISTQSDVGGWPELASVPPGQDIDSDGLPDEWERRYSPNGDLSVRAEQDLDGDGYTNVEEYLNQTDPTRDDERME